MKERADETAVFLVPHTHWDREWYLTFEEYRFFLVECLDRVFQLLEEMPNFVFTLDGQVITVLDYLEVRPERRPLLEHYVREGRLKIGPWYVQPDEFLVSAEALIRNLLLGTSVAEEFGDVMRVGYLPDSFGHIAQLPQILKGFGIDTVFLWRGADLACDAAGGPEFCWQAPDGSEVRVHVFPAGYGAAKRLFQVTADLLRRLTSAKTGGVLLPVGGDHIAPQHDFAQALAQVAAQRAYAFCVATFDDYVEILRHVPRETLATIRGELRASRTWPILAGVLSSRMPLKQANFRAQALLERYVEPLAAAAQIAKGDNLRPWLRQAWQILLQNHAHDSICGTGIDSVHNEMFVRFYKAEALGGLIAQKALEALSEKSAEDTVVVFNPCPWPRRGEVQVLMPKDQVGVVLEDSAGDLKQLVSEGAVLVSKNLLEGVQHQEALCFTFRDEFPPCGCKVYRLKRSDRLLFTQGQGKVSVKENIIENEFYRLIMEKDGTFTLVDKELDAVFPELHIIEDEGDAGDEYNFSPPQHQVLIRSRGVSGEISLRSHKPWRGALRLEGALSVPTALNQTRTGRSTERVNLPFSLEVSLQAGLKRVDIALEIENLAQDHRLRVAFYTGILAERYFVEDSFCVIQRSTRLPDGVNWIEKPSPTQPQKAFVAVEDGSKGFALLNRGLPEYEVTPEGVIYLTLLRSVGWLSRDDLSTRRGHAGPPYPTPAAQCLGRHRFAYAIYTYRGSWPQSELLRVAQEFCFPPRAFFLKGQSIAPFHLLHLEPAQLVLSAFKPAEDGKAVVIRVYNPTGQEIMGQLKFGWKVEKVWAAELDERPSRELPVSQQNMVYLAFRPGEIRTLRMVGTLT